MLRRCLGGCLLLGSLVGCSNGFGGSTAADPHLFQPWQRVPASAIGVRFDGAEAPEAIAARARIGDGVRVYEAVLANATFAYGENKLIVAVREARDDRPLALDSELVTFTFTPATVDRNFAILLKGARRLSEPTPRRNRYGAYYFVAAAYPGGAECVYAWQHVDDHRTSFSPGAADAAVQFRYCDPDRAPAELIAMFDGLVLEL